MAVKYFSKETKFLFSGDQVSRLKQKLLVCDALDK
jgi:hypothetical protein